MKHIFASNLELGLAAACNAVVPWLLQLSAALFPIKLPINAPERAADDSQRNFAPAIHCQKPG